MFPKRRFRRFRDMSRTRPEIRFPSCRPRHGTRSLERTLTPDRPWVSGFCESLNPETHCGPLAALPIVVQTGAGRVAPFATGTLAITRKRKRRSHGGRAVGNVTRSGDPRERSGNGDNSRGDHPGASRDLPGTTGLLTDPQSWQVLATVGQRELAPSVHFLVRQVTCMQVRLMQVTARWVLRVPHPLERSAPREERGKRSACR
jgi:hypothetical protein